MAGPFVYTPAAGTILTAGLHTLSVTFTPTDVVDYSSASATVTLTVTKATPTVVLVSSANPSVYGVSVTFTATTSASATGTMLFYDGGSVLGPGTLSGGVATYTLNSLGAATHSITASYAGALKLLVCRLGCSIANCHESPSYDHRHVKSQSLHLLANL